MKCPTVENVTTSAMILNVVIGAEQSMVGGATAEQNGEMILTKSILQDEKKCYITGQTNNLHRHHIFAGGRRQISEREGFVVYLCARLHNQSEDGVHGKNGHELDMMLKRHCQMKYEETLSREEWMALMGKNYLD